MNQELKNTIRQQRKTVFGKGRYWFHIAIWGFLAVFIQFNIRHLIGSFRQALPKETLGMYLDTPLVALFIIIACLISAFMVYALLLYIIPYARYKRRKRYLWLGLIANGFIWMLMLVFVVLVTIFYYPDASRNDYVIVARNLSLVSSLSATIAAYFYALYYFIDLYDQQEYLIRYEHVFTLKLQAETNFLKTQINPHFLFNTLNNIYSLTLKQSDDAPVITRRLKDLISYMLDDFSRDMVTVQEEVNFLNNYIQLEQLRNRQDQTDIRFTVNGDLSNHQIAPLLLVNFIENAFKHGVKAGIEASFVHIDLRLKNNTLILDLRNSRSNTSEKNTAIVHKGGIGILNVKRRLELLYPGNYKLRIRKRRSTFCVHLQINLQP